MQNTICPNCKAEVAPGMKFCMTCGAKMEEEAPAPAAGVEKTCAKCGAPLKEGVKFCIACGEPVSAPGAKHLSSAPSFAAAGASIPGPQPGREPAPPRPPVQPYQAPPAYGAVPPASAPSGRPPHDSPYEPISTWGYVGIFLLLMVPVIGFIFMIVWACGGCRKYNKRNLARAMLIFMFISLAVSALVYFVLSNLIMGWLQAIFGTADLSAIMQSIFGGAVIY